jgi:uncharacterized protein
MKKWFLFFCLSGAATLQAVDTNLSFPSLSVQGHASISRPADKLQISVGVVSQGKNAKIALEENNAQMNQLMAALKEAGLTKSELQTGRFSINPVYTQRPRDAKPDWAPRIVGFEVNNSVTVSTEKIDHAGAFIDAAAKGGANTIDSIQFLIGNPQIYRNELIEAATQNALKDAKALSQAAGVDLARVYSVSIDDAQQNIRQPFMMKAMGAESTPIVAGDVELSASVSLVYEINGNRKVIK